MLFHDNPLKTILLAAAVFAVTLSYSSAQQSPSRIYQPTQPGYAKAPPSVHVPPQSAQQIPAYQRPKFRLPEVDVPKIYSSEVRQAMTKPPITRSATPHQPQSSRPEFVSPPIVDPNLMRTSYQESTEPKVPAILLGSQPQPSVGSMEAPPAAATTEPKPSQTVSGTFEAPQVQRSLDEFAPAMRQIQQKMPKVAPMDLQDSLQRRQEKLRRQAIEQQKAIAAKMEAERLEQEKIQKQLEEQKRIESERIAAAQAALKAEQARQLQREKRAAQQRAEAERLKTEMKEMERVAAERRAAEPATTPQEQTTVLRGKTAAPAKPQQPIRLGAALAETQDSAKNFIQQATHHDPVSNMFSAEAKPVNSATPQTPPVEPVRDDQVQLASSETSVNQPATIALAAPAIKVETYGPNTIGLNKPAQYQIVVRNESTSKADRVLVGVNMPEWVDIENISLTSGEKEITDGKNQARLVWSVDSIPGNSTQTITVIAVPRKPEMFDVAVEWTLVPRVGKMNVRVTEPKLEMNIAGPREVLYGETALYHVTVRNPGTGSAEKVVVMLPEALGGERATLGDINPGKEKNFQVELLARTAGDLNLVATAVADGNLKTSAERALIVRRASLDLMIEGPPLKYAGSVGQYRVTITNTGDATATDVVSAIALPKGVKYLSGIDSVKLIEGGMRWPVGALDPGQTREFKINCQLDTSGDLQIEVGARGQGELAASSACLTTVETIADLVLTVQDPKGPLPTGQEVPYEIKVRNRGTKAAKGINLVMQFSDGIEPRAAKGLENRLVPGQVFFDPIEKIDPGQEVKLVVTAEALKGGTHVFRAQLTCQDSDAREVAEGTTRFFGETFAPSKPASTSTASQPNSLQGGEFKR